MGISSTENQPTTTEVVCERAERGPAMTEKGVRFTGRDSPAVQEMRRITPPRDDVVVKIDGSPEFVGT
jgi:hypothetical protein